MSNIEPLISASTPEPPAHQVPEEAPSAIQEFIASLRSRRWTVVVVTLLMVSGALFLSFRQTPIYASQAKVLVTPASLSSSTASEGLNLETERGIAESVSVAQVVAEELGSEEARTLLSGLSVGVITNTEILVFVYESESPVEAQRRAQAFANGYLEYRREQILDELLAASEAVQIRIRVVSNQLAAINAQLEIATDEVERSSLQAEANTLVAQIAILQQELNDLTPPDTLRVGQIIEPAAASPVPVRPDHVTNGLLAGVVGLGLGIGLALLRERLDNRLVGREDLEARLGAPVLAVIPTVHSWRKQKENFLVTAVEPKSAASESYRTLRTGLTFVARQRDVKTILVTSPHSGEGKTATVANLGVVLADSGKRVVVVSADLRKPRLHRFLASGNGVGLSSILSGEGRPAEALSRTGFENLRLVPSGPIPDAPADLLGSEAMGRFLTDLRDMADYVLIDSPPVLVVADAIALAPLADAILLVTNAESTSRSSVLHARQQLDHVNAQVIGGVFNNYDPSTARTSPYYYAYYYSYRYEEAPEAEPSEPQPQEPEADRRSAWFS